MTCSALSGNAGNVQPMLLSALVAAGGGAAAGVTASALNCTMGGVPPVQVFVELSLNGADWSVAKSPFTYYDTGYYSRGGDAGGLIDKENSTMHWSRLTPL
jgi:hypothetical protein